MKRPQYLAAAVVALAFLAVLWTCSVWMPTARESPYAQVRAWGGAGSKPGQFNEPTGIAIAGDEVYVSDARNGRIQVFDREGRFRRSFGEGVLGRPMNLAVAGDEVVVADYFEDAVFVFHRDGAFRRAIRPADGLRSPGGVVVGADGSFYVADTYRHRVLHLNPDGTVRRQWGVTDRASACAGRFNYPTDVAVAADGALYVADGYNDRVQVFAPDGALVRMWGGPFARNIHGPFKGWFATATSIALAPDGQVYVADFYNDRIQKFTAEGQFLTAFGHALDGPGHSLIAVDVAADGVVYAADYGRNEIQVWQPGRD